MLSKFARRVARAIRTRVLWAPGDRVAVAVSGGADSVALALALAELASRATWTFAGLIHINHQLRGDASDQDEVFCRTLARDLDLRIDVVAVDVQKRRIESGESVETAARALRYGAFPEAAGRLAATVVATAHTLDDQAETVLLRLLRGTSARGVSAIRPRRGLFARPLLDERRASVLKYLAERGQAHREDLSNQDVTIPRNRLRHRLVPVIDEVWPGGVKALARFARLASEDEALLSKVASRDKVRRVRPGKSGVELSRDRLARLPRATARRVVRDAIEEAGGRPSLSGIEAVLGLARSDNKTGHLDLASVVVSVSITAVVVSTSLAQPSGRPREFSHPLPVPGRTGVGETGTVLEASLSSEAGTIGTLSSAGSTAAMQADRVVTPLTVRSRRPGDRFKPLGAPGTRRVQDLLVDRKVPLAERDSVPIVEDRDGQIIWVAGVAVADGVRVTRPEAGVVILKINKDQA